MKIACLSGKGGAGKTMAAVNLAVAATGTGTPGTAENRFGKVVYIDCDVEEPNGHLFLKPEDVQETAVFTLLPSFDADKCTGCRKCVDFCRYHALIQIRKTPIVFPEVCHSCGGCLLVCPEDAVQEVPKQVGVLETGVSGPVRIVTGRLQPGEASGIPVIREALKQADGMTVVDCPPGSACSVMESVTDADYCILVAEPTAFGFHNFKMVYELVSLLGLPCGVIMNKVDEAYEPLEAFCRQQKLPVLARIPYDPAMAALLADGKVLSREVPAMRALFEDILDTIAAQAEAADDSSYRIGGAV